MGRSGLSNLMRPRAVRPSPSGMRTSKSTTSTCVLQGVLHGRLPGGHLGDDLDLRACQHALQPAADYFVVVGDQQSNLVLLGHAELLA